MNYLAHLFLAQPNPQSHFGNLLGDFRRGADLSTMPAQVLDGLANHYLVDKFTDKHEEVKQVKALFSNERRRFAGIAVDVVYDHFLIRHWSKFHPLPFDEFKQNCYTLLQQQMPQMPDKMQLVVGKITTDDWFASYTSVQGVGRALDNIAKRIRFSNQFSGSVEDITLHYQQLEASFLYFFPQLIAHVKQHQLEAESTDN